MLRVGYNVSLHVELTVPDMAHAEAMERVQECIRNAFGMATVHEVRFGNRAGWSSPETVAQEVERLTR